MYLLNLACYCSLNFFEVYIYHYSLQYYYKSVKEIINYVRNPIQFQGGTKIFYIYTTKKKKVFIFILCLKSIPIFTDTDTISRYHKNRPANFYTCIFYIFELFFLYDVTGAVLFALLTMCNLFLSVLFLPQITIHFLFFINHLTI